VAGDRPGRGAPEGGAGSHLRLVLGAGRAGASWCRGAPGASARGESFTYRRVKNDENDAADLADLLRMGRLAEAWIAPPEIRERRELTRYRYKRVWARTSVKDQVHAVLAKPGIPVTCSDIFGVWGSTWLDHLPLGQPCAGKVATLRSLASELATCRSAPGCAAATFLRKRRNSWWRCRA
jgi:hypothetical protein